MTSLRIRQHSARRASPSFVSPGLSTTSNRWGIYDGAQEGGGGMVGYSRFTNKYIQAVQRFEPELCQGCAFPPTPETPETLSNNERAAEQSGWPRQVTNKIRCSEKLPKHEDGRVEVHVKDQWARVGAHGSCSDGLNPPRNLLLHTYEWQASRQEDGWTGEIAGTFAPQNGGWTTNPWTSIQGHPRRKRTIQRLMGGTQTDPSAPVESMQIRVCGATYGEYSRYSAVENIFVTPPSRVRVVRSFAGIERPFHVDEYAGPSVREYLPITVSCRRRVNMQIEIQEGATMDDVYAMVTLCTARHPDMYILVDRLHAPIFRSTRVEALRPWAHVYQIRGVPLRQHGTDGHAYCGHAARTQLRRSRPAGSNRAHAPLRQCFSHCLRCVVECKR